MKTWQKLQQHPELWNRYFIREKVLQSIRRFFEAERFHEVETPLLIANPPAESYLEVFETTLLDRNRHMQRGYLSTSPEVPLKKLMTAGLGNCYALTKSFRNMEMQSRTHNPEFTVLEWYRVGVDYKEIMTDCENLIRFIHREVAMQKNGNSKALVYQGNIVDIQSPWERLTMAEAFKKWAAVDFIEFLDIENARKIVKAKGYVVLPGNTWEELYNQVFLNEVEPHLGRGRPTILYEFPGSMAALARRKAADPRFAERFEFYIEALELGDCYSELTDWKEQQQRFDSEMEEIKRSGKTTYDYDRDFITALKAGLPDCSGIAVGVDRLVMLFADVTSIQETLFFPVGDMFEGSS